MDANDLTWVRCNRCLLIFTHHVDKVKFWLTNCGHIYCHVCMNHGSSQPNCYVCQAVNPNVIQLERNIRPELQANFALIDVGILQRLMVAAKFQEKHEQWNFERAFQGLSKKGQFLKQAFGAVQRLRQNYNGTNKSHQLSKQELDELNAKLKELKDKQRRILRWEQAVQSALEQKRQKESARKQKMDVRAQTKAFSPIESPTVYRHKEPTMNFLNPPKTDGFLQTNHSHFNFGLQGMPSNNPHCIRNQNQHHRRPSNHHHGHQALPTVQRNHCFRNNAQDSRHSGGNYQPFQLQPGMTPSSKLPEFNAPLKLKL